MNVVDSGQQALVRACFFNREEVVAAPIPSVEVHQGCSAQFGAHTRLRTTRSLLSFAAVHVFMSHEGVPWRGWWKPREVVVLWDTLASAVFFFFEQQQSA